MLAKGVLGSHWLLLLIVCTIFNESVVKHMSCQRINSFASQVEKCASASMRAQFHVGKTCFALVAYILSLYSSNNTMNKCWWITNKSTSPNRKFIVVPSRTWNMSCSFDLSGRSMESRSVHLLSCTSSISNTFINANVVINNFYHVLVHYGYSLELFAVTA